jgi:hypothetical protein
MCQRLSAVWLSTATQSDGRLWHSRGDEPGGGRAAGARQRLGYERHVGDEGAAAACGVKMAATMCEDGSEDVSTMRTICSHTCSVSSVSVSVSQNVGKPQAIRSSEHNSCDAEMVPQTTAWLRAFVHSRIGLGTVSASSASRSGVTPVELPVGILWLRQNLSEHTHM